MANERPPVVRLNPTTNKIDPEYLPTGSGGGNVPAANVDESTTRRFVSDTEKTTWNGKQNALTAGPNISIVNNTISSTGGGGSTTGDVITWSAAAKGVVKNTTDQSANLQAAVNSGVNTVWFNDSINADYLINGVVNVPAGVVLKFEKGNRLVSTPITATGTFSAGAGLSGWGGTTVTGSGSSFINQLKPGSQLLVQGVVGISSNGGQGTGYSSQTYFTVTGNGAGAVLKAVVGPQGQIYGAVPVTVGYGYTSATISITDPNGTGSGFGGATAVLGKVPFGVVRSVESNTSLTLREPSRIIFSGLPIYLYAGVINGGIIEAGTESQITDGSVSLLGYRSASGKSSACWYGAKGDNNTDCAYPFQRWFDDAIYGQAIVGEMFIPAGRFTASKSVYGRVNVINGDQGVVNFSMTLRGAGNNIDLSSNTIVTFTDPLGFGFGFSRVKGLTVENMDIKGANVFTLGLGDVLTKQDATFAAPGVSTHPQRPNSLIAIDFAGGDNIPNSARYPGFEHLYNEQPNVGSTDIIARNMELRYAYLPFNVSPTGTQQNAESISTYDLRGGDCYAFASTGNTQTRQYNMYNTRVWNRCKHFIDGATFGSGGTLPHVFGANLSGVRWIVSASTRVNTFDGNNITMEICGGIGGNFSNINGTGNLTINLSNCDLRRAGANPPDANNFRSGGTTGTYTPAFQFQARCLKLNLINCEYIDNEYYGTPLNTITNTTSVLNGLHTNFGMLSLAQSYFTNVDFGTGISWSSNGTYVGEDINNPTALLMRTGVIVNGEKFSNGNNLRKHVAATSVTAINQFASTWSFTLPTSDVAKLRGGDRITMYAPTMVNEFGQTGTMFVEAGPIYQINYGTGLVTLQNPFYGLVQGMTFDVYIDQPMKVNNMHVGNASGTSITSVAKEGNSTAISLVSGDMVIHPSYPGGYAMINSIAGTTINVDRSITTPGVIGFSSYDYQKKCVRTSPSERTGEGFKVGDEITPKPGTNPGVFLWKCATAGINGNGTYAPTFTQVNLITP